MQLLAAAHAEALLHDAKGVNHVITPVHGKAIACNVYAFNAMLCARAFSV